MKKKIFLYVFVLIGLVCFSNFAFAEVLIARVNDYAPNYYQVNGKWIGISVDAYETIAKEAGIQIELRVIPWSRAINDMATKPIMIGNITPTEERAKTMHFIGPHHDEKIGLAIDKMHANEKINSLDDLVKLIKKTGKKIVYQQDTEYSEEFNRRIKNDPKFAENFHNMQMYESNLRKMIGKGRILGYLDAVDSITYNITQVGNAPYTLHSFVLSKTEVYLAVSKTISDDMLKKLQDANKRLIANGTWDKVKARWSLKTGK